VGDYAGYIALTARGLHRLAGGFGHGEPFYVRGPWRRGKPQFGHQLPLTLEQFFKVGIVPANSAC
jgi:hypothetical protein